MNERFYILSVLFLISQSIHAQESSYWTMELFIGDAYNLPSKVTVRQKGYSDESKIANWTTKPFEPAPYYSYRIGYWENNKSIEVEMLHHKLHMTNTDEVFNQYDSTFGFNFFLLNRAWLTYSGIVLRVGVGPVVSHPVNRIRGQQFSDDVVYKIVGVGTQGSVQFIQAISKQFYFTQEIKITHGRAEIPIENGTSFMTNTAFHGLIGLGAKF